MSKSCVFSNILHYKTPLRFFLITRYYEKKHETVSLHTVNCCLKDLGLYPSGRIPEGAYNRNRKSGSMEIRFVFTGFSIKGQKVTINRSHSNTFGGGWGAYIRGRSFNIRNVLFCLQVAEPITWKACK